MKRGLYGTFPSVIKKHLHRYLGESELECNTRRLGDGEQTLATVLGGDGRRLRCRNPIDTR